MPLVTLADIQAARVAIRDVVAETPCLPSPAFSEELGASIHLKCENLQRTGAFKIRGALNRLRALPADEIARGVITASAGNHAQGLALSARIVGARSIVVMPKTTPLLKIENTERLGGQVELVGETYGESADYAHARAEREGLVYVPAFDDLHVIAGQGTIGLELLEQVPDLDAVLVPVGGGGLISGVATAIKALRPEVLVYGIQTEAAPAMAESFAAGARRERDSLRSVADGIAVKRPGVLTLEHTLRSVDGFATVSEDAIRAAIVSLLEVGKTVVEGAGAVPLAALKSGCFPHLAGKRVVLLLSGGNIDVEILARVLDRSLVDDHRLVRFRTDVSDRPGSLATILQLVADGGGNIVSIAQDRVFDAGFWEAEVEMTLETRNEAHVRALQTALEVRGYRVQRLD